jgi:hypothetical protein
MSEVPVFTKESLVRRAERPIQRHELKDGVLLIQEMSGKRRSLWNRYLVEKTRGQDNSEVPIDDLSCYLIALHVVDEQGALLFDLDVEPAQRDETISQLLDIFRDIHERDELYRKCDRLSKTRLTESGDTEKKS